MIGAGTKDLANGLAQAATHFVGSGMGQGVWVVDGAGALLASGGVASLDGCIEFDVAGDRLEVTGIAAGRVWVARRALLPDGDRFWVVLTGAEAAGIAPLEAFAAGVAGILEREAIRDYEAEDTTEHLLSCFEQIRAVHDLADRLPSCETTDEMGRLCLESLLLALDVRIAGLVLREKGLEHARGLFMRADGAPPWSAEVPVDDPTLGLIAEAFDDGKVRYGPAEQFPRRPGSIEAEARSWLLVVPICFGSEPDVTVLGCLVMIDRADASPGAEIPFGNPDAELAQSVSVLLGLVLGTRLRVSAEKELQIARQIQETLVPASAPLWPGIEIAGRNRAANQVGGDYFDFLESSDGRKHVIVADVSGHNMASAMAMVMARSQLRTVLTTTSQPSAVLGALAQGLFEDLVRNELFITSFFLTVVEQSEGRTTVRFTNAGHNPPLLLRAGGDVEWLEGGGPMVGFMPEVDYAESEVVLRPGDIVVLYTDGVTEVVNRNGEMLSEAGLARVVASLAAGSAGSILGGVFDAVDRHAGAGLGEDDVTAVVIKMTSSPSSGGAP